MFTLISLDVSLMHLRHRVTKRLSDWAYLEVTVVGIRMPLEMVTMLQKERMGRTLYDSEYDSFIID